MVYMDIISIMSQSRVITTILFMYNYLDIIQYNDTIKKLN